jgi:hypothetical protein
MLVSGANMKKCFMLFALFAMTAPLGLAGPKQTGTVLSQTSVTCGEKKSKKQSLDLTCHQYVVRSGATDYTIRQQKPADQELISLNTTVEFNLDKSKIKFKANGKSYEYLVVGQAAATTSAGPSRATANPQ